MTTPETAGEPITTTVVTPYATHVYHKTADGMWYFNDVSMDDDIEYLDHIYTLTARVRVLEEELRKSSQFAEAAVDNATRFEVENVQLRAQLTAATERAASAASVIAVMEQVAREAYAFWDTAKLNDSKVGKYLAALSGNDNRVDLNNARAALAAAAPTEDKAVCPECKGAGGHEVSFDPPMRVPCSCSQEPAPTDAAGEG